MVVRTVAIYVTAVFVGLEVVALAVVPTVIIRSTALVVGKGAGTTNALAEHVDSMEGLQRTDRGMIRIKVATTTMDMGNPYADRCTDRIQAWR